MSGLAARVIRTPEELAALAPAWWDLWRRCPAATPFQTPAWLIPWWRCYAPGRLFAIAVHDGDRLVGLAPFYVEEGALGRRLLPVGISLSDSLDVLVAPDADEAVGQAIARLVRDEQPRCDAWEMEELGPDAAAWGLPVPEGWVEAVRDQSACPVLATAPGSEVLSAAVPARKLRKLRMAGNRAARRGAVQTTRIGADALSAFLSELFRLHGARWESRGEAGVVDAAVRRFHEAALPGLLAADLARLYALSIGDRVVGGYYGFFHRGRAYAYLGGFDPDYAFESPGTILIGHAIAEAAREGAQEFHFLRGQEAYKYEWGARDRWNRARSFRPEGAHGG